MIIAPLIQAVQQAATLCRTVQQRHVIASEKPGQEPVTIADYGSQAILCRAISRAFPDDAILAEERAAQFLDAVGANERSEAVRLVAEVLDEPVNEADFIRWLDHGRDRQTDRVWAIDPIDGTLGFLAMRRYTIAVGLLIEGQPVESIMGAPGYPDESGFGKLFFTDRGRAFVQPLHGTDPQSIHVSAHSITDKLTVVESFERSHAAHDRMATTYQAIGLTDYRIERLDGQDKYCMVACGEADLYLRLSPQVDYQHKSWDHAAGIALVQAAGGIVTDSLGQAIRFLPEGILANRDLVVSNGPLHPGVLRGFRQLTN